MENKWSDIEAADYVARYGQAWGEDIALRTYSSRLLGSDARLVLHGGGNTSVKSMHTNVLGESIPGIYVKASGQDMASIGPEGHPGLDLEYLRRLRGLSELSDQAMTNEIRTHLFDCDAPTPSIESLLHAFIPAKFIDHTHAEAILALTNRTDGERVVREALGGEVAVIGYVKAGFKLAKAAADAFDANPGAQGMVLMHHGIITWGQTARESYDLMIDLVSRAEKYLANSSGAVSFVARTPPELAVKRFTRVAPVLRGLISPRPDRVVVVGLTDRDALDFVDWERGRELAITPPLTPDYLIRTRTVPLWIDCPDYDDPERLAGQLREAVGRYVEEYEAYLARHSVEPGAAAAPADLLPRAVLMPGLGALCAGSDAASAHIVRDITAQSLRAKRVVAATGDYQGLHEDDLFGMEYYPLQRAKLGSQAGLPLRGRLAIVTGAAGAIGAGICRGLLEQGCHVAVTDLSGERLDDLTAELEAAHPARVTGVPLDVTDPESVAAGMDAIVRTWGGLDIAVINAGVAHVSSLKDMDLAAFQRLERINVEGTLLMLRELARFFELQNLGGDIVLVSTKNVFAPGATFGAYSATKAASHQLARIASLELAPMDVRVNMVAPDAVFSDGTRRSGLWQEIGPSRMKARGLDEAGLEEYYQSRNLLKARVTAQHVGNAVLFFVTRQTPTTGATIPVDGGLPDATPR